MSQLEKIYGVHAVQALLQHHPKRVKQIWLSEGRSEPRIQALLELAAENRVPVGQAERRELDACRGRAPGGCRGQPEPGVGRVDA